MARTSHSRRWPKVKTQLPSPLLSLPKEIRDQIYRLALVCDEPIDLWPHKWTKSEALSDTANSTQSTLQLGGLKVRHQEYLEYVRKEMATGLLGTCSQVYNEASTMFWSDNSFRFAGRSGWQGLLRFFLTIGTNARSKIRKVDVHAPIYMRWPEKDGDRKDLNGRSKNFPKMHMAKVPEEGHLDREAIQRVCAMLIQERTLSEINFIIPAGFRNGDEGYFGGYLEDHDDDTEIGRLRLERIEALDFVKKTVVVEKNGYLAVEDGPKQITNEGWGLVCLPGSFIWEKGVVEKSGYAEYEKHEVEEKRVWRAPGWELDYLDGVEKLFRDPEEVSVHANGGRQVKKAKELARELKGFPPLVASYVSDASPNCAKCWKCLLEKGESEFFPVA